MFITNSGYQPDNFIDSLIKTGLVYIRQDTLCLLTKECGLLILPDGRFAAGENCSGKLTRWSLKMIDIITNSNL